MAREKIVTVHLSPGCPVRTLRKPVAGGIVHKGFLMAASYQATLSPVNPADGVVRREISVTDGNGVTGPPYLADPSTNVFAFTVPIGGTQGSFTFCDVDAAGNRSPNSDAFLFTIPVPDTTGPDKPSVLDIVYLGEVPDNPVPVPVGRRASCQPGKSARFRLPV